MILIAHMAEEQLFSTRAKAMIYWEDVLEQFASLDVLCLAVKEKSYNESPTKSSVGLSSKAFVSLYDNMSTEEKTFLLDIGPFPSSNVSHTCVVLLQPLSLQPREEMAQCMPRPTSSNSQVRLDSNKQGHQMNLGSLFIVTFYLVCL